MAEKLPAGTLWLVFAGGGTGTLLRHLLQEWGPSPNDGVDLITFNINVVGAFILGALTPPLATASPKLAALVGPGLMGGFTTYSAMLVFPMMASRAGAVIPSISYVVATIVLGAVAAWIGIRLGKWLKARGTS